MANEEIEDVVQLRAIIHGLRVAGLGFVDPEALTSIQQRIKNLPSPESLTEMSGKRDLLKKVSQEVGEIIELIEIYGKRNEESKQRNLSIKGLPPRYKILEWRQAMKIDKNVAIRDLVNLSSALDRKGETKLASKVIVCAKSVNDDTATEASITEIINEINASGNESLLKEAGPFGSGFMGGLQNVLRGPKESFQQGKLDGQLKNVLKAIRDALQYYTQVSGGIQDASKKAQMDSVNQVLNDMQNEAVRAMSALGGAPAAAAPAGTPAGAAPAPGAAAPGATPAGGPAGSAAPGAAPDRSMYDRWIGLVNPKQAKAILDAFANLGVTASNVSMVKVAAFGTDKETQATLKWLNGLQHTDPESFKYVLQQLKAKIPAPKAPAAKAPAPGATPAAPAPAAPAAPAGGPAAPAPGATPAAPAAGAPAVSPADQAVLAKHPNNSGSMSDADWIQYLRDNKYAKSRITFIK